MVESCSAARISEQVLFPSKTLLYILSETEKIPKHLNFVGNIARMLESNILVLFFANDSSELDAYQSIYQDIKSASNYSKIKFSSVDKKVEPSDEINKIKEEKNICALAFSSKEEALTRSIFSTPQIHTGIPVFAL